jgi:hypothetical protein
LRRREIERGETKKRNRNNEKRSRGAEEQRRRLEK